MHQVLQHPYQYKQLNHVFMYRDSDSPENIIYCKKSTKLSTSFVYKNALVYQEKNKTKVIVTKTGKL